MANKRSWLVRSSSTGKLGSAWSPADFWDKEPATEAAPADLWDKYPAPDAASAPKNTTPKKKLGRRTHDGRSIFMVGSPERKKDDSVSERKDQSYGLFFQACALCKNRIPEVEDVFMYGHLQAFCSPDCRKTQVDADVKSGKFVVEPLPVAREAKPALGSRPKK